MNYNMFVFMSRVWEFYEEEAVISVELKHIRVHVQGLGVVLRRGGNIS